MGERLRVLCLVKGLGAGGAERLIVSLAHARDRAVFDYEVLHVLPWKTALVPELVAEGVPVGCLQGGREWDLRWAGRLRRRLLDRRYDVVHAHSPYVAGITRLLLRTLPRRRRPRMVTTEHIPWHAHAWPTRLLTELTFPLDDAHFAVSEEVRGSVPRRHRARVETVVHGVALDAVRGQRAHREAVRAELGLGAGDVVVGTIANFRRQKAYGDLLAAARGVVDAGAPVRFVAVGQGPLEAEIMAQHAELGLGDRFRFLGGRTDATRVLAACDVFALASHYEGYPVAVMEALAIGLPVVATGVGGVPDAVRDGVEGLLVPPGRPDLLAAAIGELAGDPEGRARMGAAAWERGAEFDITRAARRVEAVYRQLTSVAAARP